MSDQDTKEVEATPMEPGQVLVPEVTEQPAEYSADATEQEKPVEVAEKSIKPVPTVAMHAFKGEHNGIVFDIPVDIVHLSGGQKFTVEALDNLVPIREVSGAMAIKAKAYAGISAKHGEQSPLVELEDPIVIYVLQIVMRQRMYLTKSMIVTLDK